MDRRDFLKKTAMVAAGTAIAAPVSAMLANAESAGILENEMEPQPRQTAVTAGKPKVLLVNGSPRPDGNTFCALSEIETQLRKLGVETELLQIGQKPVRMCINCGACHQSGKPGCVFDDDLCNTIVKKMVESDAIVVGTPVYYGQPNGGILSLMQRVFFSSSAYLQNKPAAAVAVCRRGGATATLQTMNMMFEMTSMPVIGSQYWNIVYGRDKGEAKLDKEGMQTMRTLASNMAWLLEKIHAGGSLAPVREKQREVTNFIR